MLHVVVVIVACIVWYIVYTPWSEIDFLIAEISWSGSGYSFWLWLGLLFSLHLMDMHGNCLLSCRRAELSRAAPLCSGVGVLCGLLMVFMVFVVIKSVNNGANNG